MKKTVLFAIFSLIILQIHTQNEASNWYFGENAGIQFNVFTGEVTPLSDGKINTREGCTSISNSRGELLFYTDGTTVYNGFHDVMPNGDGLLGDESSTQSAIVVPKPNAPNIYYIFTVGSVLTNTGLNYSVVDISANAGAGEVLDKNTNLIPLCAEKISAVVKDCTTKSIWVITLANSSGTSTDDYNTFFAYEISPLGVNRTPVKSSFGFSITDSRGYLKLSPDGTKLACANVRSGLYLFDFNSETGQVTNSQLIRINDGIDKSYGIEFSPNSKILYVTASNNYFNLSDPTENDNPANHNSVLLQFNLNAHNISESMVVLDRRQLYRGGLQLGPNGKIYRALSNTYNSGINGLGAINNPNRLGTNADYQHNAISLTSNSTQGLPPFIASFFNQQIDIIKNGQESTYLPLCAGETYTLKADDIPGAKYTWTRNGVLLPESDYSLEVTQNGLYKVLVEPPRNITTKECGFPQGEAFVEYFNYPIANDATLFQCDLDLSTPNITTFNLEEANELITTITPDITVTYHSLQTDAINGDNAIINFNNYENSVINEILYTRVTHNISGCSETGSLRLSVSNVPASTFKAEPICDEQDSPDGINLLLLEPYTGEIIKNLGLPRTNTRIKFFATIEDALLEKDEISEFTNTIPYSQSIYYRVETINNNACYSINNLELSINKLPDLEADETRYYCLNTYPEKISIGAGILDGSVTDYSYLWSTGETTPKISINSTGVYLVTVTNLDGCSKTRTITVEPSNIATFQNPPFKVKDTSANNSITVFATGQGTYQYSLIDLKGNTIQPYQDSNVFENVSPGIYTVSARDIKNNCGSRSEKVSIIGFPKFFTPNNDGVNDTWQVMGVSEMFQPNTKIQIYDRFGKLIKQLDPIGEGWNGLFNGQKLPTDDYWFSIQLQDGRIFKSHFTLKN